MSEARRITAALGGKWYGRYGAVCCPAHHDTRPSLTIADASERLLLHCKAGCDFTDVLAALRWKGVLEGTGRMPEPDPAALARAHLEAAQLAAKREQQALACWSEALPISGTPAEAYLRGRGITCALPESLRYHPSCWHPDAGRLAKAGRLEIGHHQAGYPQAEHSMTGRSETRRMRAQGLPAMLARVDGAAHFAIHRTYLRPDGSGKADVQPAKAMLGSTAGGAVRVATGQVAFAHPTLTEVGTYGDGSNGDRGGEGFHEGDHHASNYRGSNASNRGDSWGNRGHNLHENCIHVESSLQQGPLVVAEGIETALSLASGLVAGPATIWAALSTSGMGALNLPAKPHRLIIATDGDAAGQTAGHLLAERAQAIGWDVSHLPAPKGRDWNDVLCNDVLMQGANADHARIGQSKIEQSWGARA